MGGECRAVLDAGHGHPFGAQPQRGARRIDGDIATPDHHHTRSHGEGVTECPGPQQIDAPDHPGEPPPLERKQPCLGQTESEQHRPVSRGEQGVHRVVPTAPLAGAQLDAVGEHTLHLGGDDLTGQPVFGHAEPEHAARHRLGLEDGDRIAEQSQVTSRGQTGGARPHHRHPILEPARRRLDRVGGAGLVGHEALDGGDRDRLVETAPGALLLALVGADAPADARERVGCAGDPVGIRPPTLGGQRDVTLGRGVRRAGGGAGGPAPVVDGEGGRDRVGEGARDRLAPRHPEIELALQLDRAHRGAGPAADALVAHEPRVVTEPDPELTGWSAQRDHLGQGVHVDPVVGRSVGKPRTKRAHRAVLGRECLGEPGHVPAQRLLPLDEVDRDPGTGQLLGRREPADAAAHDERGAVQEGARRLERALPSGAGDGRGEHGRSLALRLLGLVAVDEGTALAEVGEGDGVLTELQVARDPLEGGALEATGAGADDDPVQATVGDHILDQPAPLGAAEELRDGDIHNPVE